MARTATATATATKDDAQALFQSLRSAYSATPTNLKIIDLYVIFAIFTAVIQVGYMAVVGSFPFNSFLSGVLSCVGTAVLAVCLRIQVNKENKEFKDLPPERAFADFILANLVLHLKVGKSLEGGEVFFDDRSLMTSSAAAEGTAEEVKSLRGSSAEGTAKGDSEGSQILARIIDTLNTFC